MMWWLIIAAPAALVAYEVLDEDRRAVWAKRWAEFGEHCGRALDCLPPRDRRRSPPTLGLEYRKLRGAECYTCGLLNREVVGPHEHPFEDLVAAERVERELRPHRSKALWQLVAHARRGANQPEREGGPA